MTANPTPELFRHFPELRDRMPWVPLARATPVERMPRLESLVQAHALWVKRDDRTSDLCRGNAARKLEFVFGEVLRGGARRVVTFGDVGSRDCLAVAAFARHFDLGAVLALSRRRAGADAQRIVEIEHGLGAELHRLDGGPRSWWRLLRAVTPSNGADGERRRPNFVWPRRAQVAGALGYVNAAFELARQVRVGLLPEPERMYVGATSGATAAGLWLGCHLAGLQSTVVAVTKRERRSIERIAGAALGYLARRTRGIQGVRLSGATLVVHGVDRRADAPPADAAAHHAGGLARDLENLDLETGGLATMAALVEDARLHPAAPLLFWHVAPAAPVVLPGEAERLPREFRELFVTR